MDRGSAPICAPSSLSYLYWRMCCVQSVAWIVTMGPGVLSQKEWPAWKRKKQSVPSTACHLDLIKYISFFFFFLSLFLQENCLFAVTKDEGYPSVLLLESTSGPFMFCKQKTEWWKYVCKYSLSSPENISQDKMLQKINDAILINSYMKLYKAV